MGVTGGNACSGGIYVVAVTKDNEIEFWAAATRRSDALAAVQQLLAPGWTATSIMDWRLTPMRIAALKFRTNSVSKL
jgi:hypothetical protein